jgi:hypothetical protein
MRVHRLEPGAATKPNGTPAEPWQPPGADEPGRPPRRYGLALRTTVSASAGPYGYTLTVWTSGAVLAHAHGIPSAAEALLFLAGAVTAYGLVAGAAAGTSRRRLAPDPAHAAVWGGLHLFSVGLAIGAAWLDARLVTSLAAWPVGGFAATALYLIVSAGQLAIADAAHRGTTPHHTSGEKPTGQAGWRS